MLNQIVCVGRLIKEIEQLDDKTYSITISVPRNYKNADGEYENDVISFRLWNGVVDNAKEYLHIGDLVGIKGRLQSVDNQLIAMAEKLTFLSSKKEEV